MQEKQTNSRNSSRDYLHLNPQAGIALFAILSALIYVCLTIFIINIQTIHTPIVSAASSQESSKPTKKSVDSLNEISQDEEITIGTVSAEPSFVFRAAVNGYRSDTPPGPYLAEGEIVTWTYTITNTGNVAFNNIIVSNQFSGTMNSNESAAPIVLGDNNKKLFLDVDEAWIFLWRQTVRNGIYIANPTISADPVDPILGPDGQPLLTMTASDIIYYVGVRPAIELTIEPNRLNAETYPGPAIVAAEPMTWTYVIINSGTTPLSNILLEDDTYGTIDTQVDGDSNNNGLLDIDEQWVYEISDIAATGQQTRTAQISAEPSDINGIRLSGFSETPFALATSAANGYYFGVRPSLSMNYYAGDLREDEDTDEDRAYMASDGEDIPYTFLIENSGDIALKNLVIRDDNGTVDNSADDFLLSNTQCAALAGPLPPGGTALCRLQKNIVYSDTIHTSHAAVTGVPIGADDQPLVNVAWPVARDEATVVRITPGLQLEHTMSAGHDNGASCPGDSQFFFTGTATVTHCYLATNSGNVPLDKVQLFDDRGNFLFAHDQLLAPAQSVEFFMERTVDASVSVTTTAVGKPSDANGVPYDGQEPVIVTNAVQMYQEEISVGGIVWYDDDGNGQLNEFTNEFTEETALDSGVAEIVVYLLDGLTGDGILDSDGKPLQSITENDGRYLFENLHPRNYVVKFDLATLPSGYKPTVSHKDESASQSTANADTGRTSTTGILFGGEEDRTLHMGIIKGTQVGGQVWIDNDQDELQDDGEPGLAKVQMTLLDSDTGQPILGTDGAAITAMTDEQGRYLFEFLPAGKYAVRLDVETLPTGYLLLHDDPERAVAGILSGSQGDLTLDFALMETFQLGGRVWYDNNDNGIQGIPQEEQGVWDVAVTLLDGNTGHPLQTESGVPISARTDIDGRYLFENLSLGSYAIHFDLDTLPTNHIPTMLDVNDDEKDSDGDPITGLTAPIEFRSNGPKNFMMDLGIRPDLTVQVGGQIWFDPNRDGQRLPLTEDQSADSPDMSAISVMLLDGDTEEPIRDDEGNLLAIKTNANGHYLFDDLPAGNYRVHFVLEELPAGYVATIPNRGSNSSDSDVDISNGYSHPTEQISAGTEYMNLDLGIMRPLPGNDDNIELDEPPSLPAILGDTVWFDLDHDGILDDDENGIEGITMHLYDEKNFLVRVTKTSASGFYLFTDITPGDYRVQCIQKLGYQISPQNVGDDSMVDSDVDLAHCRTPLISLASGDYADGWDVGLYTLDSSGVISNQVWFDTNQNGRKDPGASGVSGVLVDLYNTRGELLWTVRTDSTGGYRFYDLPHGTYYIEFLPAPEYVSTLQAQSGDGRKVRTPIISLNETANQASGAMLGLHLDGVMPASLDSQVWHDLNLDGLKDEDEPGLPNVLVRLYDENERISATATTDEDGRYLFQGLVPKTYRLEFASPEGFQPNTMNDDTDLEQIDELTLRTAEITLDNDVNDLILEAGFVASPTDIFVTSETEFVNLYLPLIYKP